MMVTQYTDTVKLDEDYKEINLAIFNKKGHIIARKKITRFHQDNIPHRLLITYKR